MNKMIPNPDINNLIWMYRHYEGLAQACWDQYDNLVDWYFMYDYNMHMARTYEEEILRMI